MKEEQVADTTKTPATLKKLGMKAVSCTGSLGVVKNIHPVCTLEKKEINEQRACTFKTILLKRSFIS